ncbi:MAG: hydroxyacylglutathione hydrolase [Proteobacteria bacterium]|nr:hydroxyacylglutathione hydrolase [Pseudomonadota bacterium]
MNNTQVYPVKAFQDNYIWTIHNQTHAVIVDPGDSKPVLDFLTYNDLILSAILITHHHADHIGGIANIIDNYNVPVYGPKTEDIPNISHRLVEGDEVKLDELGLMFNILDIPGHTSGHIAYFDEQRVFSGDTLFSCGCGRIFEGTPPQMFRSLQKLARLSDSTEVYCTHEYTLSNIKFARAVEPNNTILSNYEHLITSKLSNQQISLPTSIGLEKSVNPFLRCDEPTVISTAQTKAQETLSNPIEVFTAIRKWKNDF